MNILDTILAKRPGHGTKRSRRRKGQWVANGYDFPIYRGRAW